MDSILKIKKYMSSIYQDVYDRLSIYYIKHRIKFCRKTEWPVN